MADSSQYILTFTGSQVDDILSYASYGKNIDINSFPLEVARDYLKKADASNTYLNIEQAASIYLTQTDADNIYLSKEDASDTYLTQENASSTYQTILSSTNKLPINFIASIANVARTGSYNDLSDKPNKISITRALIGTLNLSSQTQIWDVTARNIGGTNYESNLLYYDELEFVMLSVGNHLNNTSLKVSTDAFKNGGDFKLAETATTQQPYMCRINASRDNDAQFFADVGYIKYINPPAVGESGTDRFLVYHIGCQTLKIYGIRYTFQ